MQHAKLSTFKDGWVIGNFEPSLWKNPYCEIAYKYHRQGSIWPKHKQVIATEYNLLTHGLLTINQQLFGPGDIFVIEPGECAEPHFLKSCEVLVVKQPSLPGDKVLCS